MHRREALQRAQDMLAEVESPGEPLRLAPEDEAIDIGWAWVLPWSTERWFFTEDPRAAPPPGYGPIVIVKQSSDSWFLATGPSYDEQLAQYARNHGLEHTKTLG